jgi:hypothetical protein
VSIFHFDFSRVERPERSRRFRGGIRRFQLRARLGRMATLIPVGVAVEGLWITGDRLLRWARHWVRDLVPDCFARDLVS